MPRHGVIAPNLPAPAGAYSHVVEIGNVVYTAGFGPQDPATGQIPDGIEAQTDQVIANVRTALEAVGLGLDDVVKTTVHLADLHGDFAGYNAAYSKHFAEPFPARTTVGSTLMGILVEIDAIAIRPA